MSDVQERLAALPIEKQRLLWRQIEQEGGAAGLFQLSFSQQRLWFLDQLTPGSPLYNMMAAHRFQGELDFAALTAAAEEIVRRHEILRTTFLRLADQPVQRVSPPAPPRFPRVDLGGLPAARREAEARRLVAEEGRIPFDLRRGPLLRLTLLRLDDAEHLLLLTFHHIVADGWSIGIFLGELAALYDTARNRRPSPLSDLALQYRDFARWQRRFLEGERLEAEIAHWRERLASAPPEIALPHDRPRPAVPSFRGATVPYGVPPALTRELRDLGAGQGATLFMTLLTAFAACLHHLGGGTDLPVGTVVANRTRREIEPLLGVFVNTLVLRADLSGAPSFLSILRRVQAITLDAYAHQDLPFEKLVEALHPERSVNRSPLFQVAFDLLNLPVTGGPQTAVAAAALDTENGTAKFDLRLFLQDDGERLAGGFELAVDLFDRTTVMRLAGQLTRVLEAVARDPETPLAALALLSAAERHQALVEWNDSAAPRPEAAVHDLFAAAVRRTPRATAVITAGERLSYLELDRRADRLASRLAGLGVSPGAIVGLWLERSPGMVVALLAVWKAGAAYLPLDAASPRERLSFLLDDAGIAALVTQEHLRDRLPRQGAPLVLVNAGGEVEGSETTPPLRPTRVSPDHPAYVIYTSGSTGKPKGVVIPHRGLANYLLWAAEVYGAAAGAGSLVHSPFAFDLTLTGLLAPLLAGGTVRLAPESDDPEALARALRAVDDLTLVKLTPAHLELLRRQLAPAEAAGRARTFVIGGEALVGENVAFFSRNAPETRLINEYGPTETVVGCAIHELAPGEPPPERVPIGRPIANLRLYVLDRALQPAPLGAVGELYIGAMGGAAVAQGYLGRPDLTAERFLPDPNACELGARLYRSGDLARLRGDGTLLYLGRTDDQVKVRGFRIELGEIEAALARLPAVDAAAVTVAGESAGERRLVAYVVPRGGAAVNEAELKALLETTLPRAMVPGAIFAVDALPLTANGKLDRAALPGLVRRQAPATRPSLPATALEETVAAIWREVLGRDEVGLDDNFFDLGGHSLLLAGVHGRLRQTVPVELPLIDLFNNPTVRTVAAHLSRLLSPAASEAGSTGGSAPAGLARRQPAAGTTGREAIAVLGIGLRVPGASNPEELWQNLREGVEGITFFTAEELLAAGVPPEVVADPRYVRGKGSMRGVELFDAPFFRLNRRQAEVTDPQNRIFFECVWEALEDAGYFPDPDGPSIGVFAGKGVGAYAALLQANPTSVEIASDSLAILGNEKDHLATHTAYLLDLQGPALTVQTSCSTSLVAIHLACQSLLAGDCDLALAGGASVDPIPTGGYFHVGGGLLSPDGHCRPFDATAGGTVGGSGVAVVVLKRLSEALSDGDPIRAVLLGSAINNDGAQKVGYTAPRVEGQARVIATALDRAGVTADTISYVEAHGTGTEMGDPIEIAALTRAFRESTDRRGYCAVGSLKSNLGHLDSASGAAGFIKAVLSLEHRELAPTLHFTAPNPAIDFAASPFYVSPALLPWPEVPGPRRAGVSSFGLGGTNAHAVLEEAPALPVSEPGRPWQLLVLSARTENALEAATDRLETYLGRHPEVPLADIAHTLQVGRKRMAHRRIVVARDTASARQALSDRDPAHTATLGSDRQGSPWVLLLPGQGAQFAEMGRELYEGEPLFRETVDAASALLSPLLGQSLKDVLYPEIPGTGSTEDLLGLRLGQPALFVVEYALARLLISWLGPPAAMLGYSTGEYVAACLAGVFTLADALTLITVRAKLAEDMPPGAMLAVNLPPDEIPFAPGAELSISAVNGPARTIVAGAREAVAELEGRLLAAGQDVRRLPSEHAYHSPGVLPIVDRFLAQIRSFRLSPPRLPYLSNVTGDWVHPEQATDPDYWAGHLMGTVRWSAGLETLFRETDGPLVEAGPGRTLSSLARQHPGRPAERLTLPTLGRSEESGSALAAVLGTVGRAWLAGVAVDWAAFHAGARRLRVHLPTYPFERQSYWFTPGPAQSARSMGAEDPSWRMAWPASGAAAEDGAAALGARRTRNDPPKTEVERILAGIWRDLLGVEVGRRDNYFELGGDSMIALHLTGRVRSVFRVEIPLRKVLESPTVAELGAAIEALLPQDAPALRGPREEAPTLVEIQPGDPSRLPFFTVHAAGGNVLSYYNLARRLGRERPVYALQAPGLEGEGQLFERIEELAAHHVQAVRTAQPHGPYLVGGWSAGGAIAFEMARQLRSAGEEVLLVALFDTYSPKSGELLDDIRMLLWQAVRYQLPVSLEELTRYGTYEARVDHLIARAREAGILPPQVDQVQAQRMVATELRILRAILNYRPAVLDARLAYFRCLEGAAIGADYEELFPHVNQLDHPAAWRELSTEPMAVYDVPGEHGAMMEEPNVGALAEHLAAVLAEVEAAATVGKGEPE